MAEHQKSVTDVSGNGSNVKQSLNQNSSQFSNQIRVPEFFLYTKLGQNETKSLRKAPTNKAERKVLAQIFHLNSLLNPSAPPNKIELLKLDFHYMNYVFCKDQQFSNEKTSTMLAMLDTVLNRMLEKSLNSTQGLKMLKLHLNDHSIQTPPYAIFLFTQSEIKAIVEFSLQTFLRHYSLYEFAFKPRVDLVLRSDPVINDKLNSRLESLDLMETVDSAELERLKAFIGLGEYQTQTFVQQQQ